MHKGLGLFHRERLKSLFMERKRVTFWQTSLQQNKKTGTERIAMFLHPITKRV